MRHAISRAEHTLVAQAPKEVYNHRVYVLAVVASMGAILFGYDLAFIGTTLTLKPFKNDFGLNNLSESQQNAFAANVVSLLQAGCFFGSLAAAPISDKYGRKLILSLVGLLFCVGSAIQTASHGSKVAIYIGRVIGGLGVGAASMLVPLYIAEVSPPSIRGRLVGIYEIGVQLGTLIGFWINYGVNQDMAPTSSQWITPFAFQLIPGGFLTLGMLFLPESPRWTARTKGREAAVSILSRLRNLASDHPYLQEEATAIVIQIEEERMLTSGKGLITELREISRPGYRRRLIIGMLIFVFMQMAGSNAINYYSPRIFNSIGLRGTSTTLISTGIYGIVRFVTVCFAMYILVDRVGRKKLLLVGSVGMMICMYYLGAYATLNPIPTSSAHNVTPSHLTASTYAAAVMLYIYGAFFALSWAGIPWIYASEIFPTRIRSLAMSFCVATHWLFNFMIARATPYMISNIGGGTYFLFAACLTLSLPFVWFFVPETKGRSLEDMDAVFGGSLSPIPEDSSVDEEKATLLWWKSLELKGQGGLRVIVFKSGLGSLQNMKLRASFGGKEGVHVHQSLGAKLWFRVFTGNN